MLEASPSGMLGPSLLGILLTYGKPPGVNEVDPQTSIEINHQTLVEVDAHATLNVNNDDLALRSQICLSSLHV